MTIKFVSPFYPDQDPDGFNPAFPPTPSPSPSATLCGPCDYTYTFTKTLVIRLVAAGASIVLGAPASEFDGDEIRDRSAEVPLHSILSDIRPKFHLIQLREFTLKELKLATGKFSQKNIIGRGGFGIVYKGRLADGSFVAIKRCKKGSSPGRIFEFETEITAGSIRPSHRNLLPMLGFCRTSKDEDLLLVSSFMVNESAASRLRDRQETQPPLDWPTRRKIAVGVARGLSHLHDLNIVHRDIKAANILLDEEFEPHIGDFGLAKFIDCRHGGFLEDCIEEAPVLPGNEREAGSNIEYSYSTTAVRGTLGHIAPEYLSTGQCSVKNDIYGFGIMLLELLTGQRAFDLARNDDGVMLLDWVRRLLKEPSEISLADPDMEGAYDEMEAVRMIQLALLCTESDPSRRPSMAEVVRFLQGQSIESRWQAYLIWHFDDPV